MDRRFAVVAWALAGLLAACGAKERSVGTDDPAIKPPVDPPAEPPAEEPPAEPPAEEPPPPPPPRQGLLEDPDAPFSMPPLQLDVPVYELEVAPENLDALAAQPREDVMYPAIFVAGGVTYDVMIRYRGNSSRVWPKKSWRVEFPKERKFDGRHKLNLLSEWRDQSMMVEKLGYDLLAAMGGVASEATYVRLIINGQNQGVYLDLERVDKNFLENHGFADLDATIYRCGRKDCEMKEWQAEFQTEWEKETNELTPGMDDLRAFLRTIHVIPEDRLPEELEKNLELELYIRMMVADALISNDTIEDSRSYLIHDKVTGRWHYAPWDLNNSSTKYQPGNEPGKTADIDQPLFVYTPTNTWAELEYQRRMSEEGGHPWHALFSDLSARIQFNAVTRGRLLDRLQQALDTLFKPEILDPRIDAMYVLIEPHTIGDPTVERPLFDDGPRYMKEFVALRSAFLRDELTRLRATTPGVKIDAVDTTAGRIVLRNYGTEPVSLAGWILTNNTRVRGAANLGAQTLGPGETLELGGPAYGLSTGPVGELGLWSGPALDQVVDLFFHGPGSWERDPADPGRWRRVE